MAVYKKMNKALFLDRDGVINIEKNYLYRVEDLEFIDGIFEVVKYYYDKGYLIIIVTNQSGIARGYFSEDDFWNLMYKITKEFEKRGVKLTHIYYCPHHPDITGECECRKPKPGMILEAIRTYNIDPQQSILIGDSKRDIEAANNAGIENTYFVKNNLKDYVRRIYGK